jgi:ABC-type transport system involved in cytochrome bd biosynthesis fused ATPase/permease subunit
LFGANLVLASAIINATIGYAMREEDLRDDTVAEQELRSFFRSRLWTTLILVVAAALAIVAPLVAVFIYLGVSLAYLVAPIVSAARTRRRPKARA